MTDTTAVVSSTGTTVLWILLAAVIVAAVGFWLIFGRKRKAIPDKKEK